MLETPERQSAQHDLDSQALIQEARQHQRKRYRRNVGMVLGAVSVVAALVVGLVVMRPSSNSPTTTDGRTLLGLTAGSSLLFRPVLCTVQQPANANVAEEQALANQADGQLPTSCGAAYDLTPAHLDIQPQPGLNGYSIANVLPDPDLAAFSMTTHDVATKVVLLSGFGVEGGRGAHPIRYLLGPALLQLRRKDFHSITMVRTVGGGEALRLTLNSPSAKAWDAATRQMFHAFVAFDVDGKVISEPIIEPAQRSYTSMKGVMEISVPMTNPQFVAIEHALRS